jgi:hypothetical protein
MYSVPIDWQEMHFMNTLFILMYLDRPLSKEADRTFPFFNYFLQPLPTQPHK